jgi:hypothetical protein
MEPLKNLDILFFISVISVPSVVFQRFKSTTEGTEFTEHAFSEIPYKNTVAKSLR